MPTPSTQTISLEALRQRLLADVTLASAKRSELASAIKRFAEICDRTPAEIVADPAVIRVLASKASWQLAGLTAGGWSNLKSRLSAALRAGGIPVHRRSRRNFVLSPSWEHLLAGVDRPRPHRTPTVRRVVFVAADRTRRGRSGGVRSLSAGTLRNRASRPALGSAGMFTAGPGTARWRQGRMAASPGSRTSRPSAGRPCRGRRFRHPCVTISTAMSRPSP